MIEIRIRKDSWFDRLRPSYWRNRRVLQTWKNIVRNSRLTGIDAECVSALREWADGRSKEQ